MKKCICDKCGKQFEITAVQYDILINDKNAYGLCPDCSCDHTPAIYSDLLQDRIIGNPETELISNPSHYCEGRKYEPKDVIRDWDLNFNLGNVVKYVSRNGRKEGENALKDLKKARQYLEFEIEAMEKETK